MFRLRIPSSQHCLHVAGYVLWVITLTFHNTGRRFSTDYQQEDPFEKYGSLVTYFSIGVRLLSVLIIPQMLALTLGFILFDIKQPSVDLKCSLALAPFICIRIVTRGLYPTLINQNVRSHLQVMSNIGITNFVVEVVTDNPLKVDLTALERKFFKQTVVPDSYTTRAGTLNKARALQYCLEEGVNTLSGDDWLVHLDEETRITVDSMKGILNFVCQDKHQFGQGVITYGSLPPLPFDSWWTEVQNRLCTVADSVRVADDLGKHKAQFKLLHKPFFGIKGSFVITKFAAEREVGWDFGPPGSKAEDAWMSLVAIDKGYTFDFVEGDMLERSPFTFSDFFKQRRRWMQGIFMVVTTPTILLRTRILMAFSLASWLALPFSTIAVVMQFFYPFDLPSLTVDVVLSWVGATALYLYIIGYARQFNVTRMSWFRLALSIPEILIASTISLVAENLAVILMWFGNWYTFYIVQKEVPGMDTMQQLNNHHEPLSLTEREGQQQQSSLPSKDNLDNHVVHTV